MDERLLKIIKRRLNYSEEEIKLFKNRPENKEILEKSHLLSGLEIVAQVVSSKAAIASMKWVKNGFLTVWGIC